MKKSNKLSFILSLFILVISFGCSHVDSIKTIKSKRNFIEAPKYFIEKIDEARALKLTQEMLANFKKNPNYSLKNVYFAMEQSLAYVSLRKSSDIVFNNGVLAITNGQITSSLKKLLKILPLLDKQPDLLAKNFVWYRISPNYLLTGYYEPTLNASKKKSAKYHYPLYRLPSDVKKGVPFHSRNSIDRKGALKDRKLEIAWVNSEVDAFFLHIQGSGRLLYDDGSVSHILYAGKNNHAYVPLGRVLRDRELLASDDISMQSIKRVLKENPKLQSELLDTNPSYVFFRESKNGPFGSIGKQLTPWVSVAVDKNVLPYGGVMFLFTLLPNQVGEQVVPFYSLVTPQDTGGAIKNHRIDLFCGAGKRAEEVAGFLDNEVAVYLLLSIDEI